MPLTMSSSRRLCGLFMACPRSLKHGIFFVPSSNSECRSRSMSKQTIRTYVMAGLLLLCAAGTAAAQSSDAERLYANAVRLHQAGDIENAIREYKAFLVLYPNVVEARSNLGAAYARLGRYEEAIEQYRQALALKPDNTQIRFNLALAYYKGALYSEAAAEFSKVRAADPSNKNALLLLADCHLQTGETKKVIELLAPPA